MEATFYSGKKSNVTLDYFKTCVKEVKMHVLGVWLNGVPVNKQT